MLDEEIRREVSKYEPGDKKPKKKIDGLVGTKKNTGGIFFEEDLKTAAKSIYKETVVPTVKDSAASIIIGWVEGIGGIFVDLIERMIYGSDARAPRRGSGYYHRTSYDGYYDRRRRVERSGRVESREKEKTLEYEEIIMETRPQCKDLLMELEDDIDRYGKVTIADLYEHAGKTGGSFGDNYYGWRDLSGAFIKEVPEGFWLRLPRPVQLD